ncbi:MAG: AAA family ATPase [Arcobacteraceae bacterium]|jgi:predicted ATP-binding protein involved in virulence|nr:AAA family ATPase [Arcobacteraceae bacterium]
MELVYLWVEKYKNIENEGFNFSPRFECEFFPEYDIYQENGEEKKKLKDNCKLEIKPKEYTSIFPDNINVTAIVGENGSGKSNILTFLSIYSELMHDLSNPLDIMSLTKKKLERRIGNSFFVFYINNKFVKSFGIDCEFILNGKNITYESDFIQEHFTLSYNFMLENRYKFWYYNFNISNKLFVQPNKSDNSIDFEFLDNESNKFLLFNILEFDKKIKLIDDFFIPNYFTLEINRKFYLNLQKLNKKLFNKLSEFQNKVIKIKKNAILSLNDIKLLNSIFYVLYIDEQRKYPTKKQYKISKEYSNILKKDNFEEKVNFFLTHNYDEIFDENIQYIQHDFKFIKFLEDNKIDNIHNSIYTFNDEIEFLKALPNWIDIRIYNEKNLSFSDLSNGERFLIKFIFNLVFYLMKIKKENFLFINIFLDEIDLGLHPQWQKKFLNLILNIFKNYHIKLNIILTSHSPFILSDLPKENIIFLNKYKEDDIEVKNGNQKIGNCKNVTKETNIETFGTNIHTRIFYE